MNAEIKNKLNEVLADVLEKQAFMFAEPAEIENLAAPLTENYRASMSFEGPYSGRITLAAPLEMCREIAANVLGIEPDEEISEASAKDSLKEVLNVLCGNLLTALAGSGPEFDISIPDTGELDAAGWKDLYAGGNTAGYMVDEFPVLVVLNIEGG